MAKIPIRDVGALGLLTDVAPHELPPNAWSRVENVVFRDKGAMKAKGCLSNIFGPLPVTPFAVFFAPSTTEGTWVYCGEKKVYAYTGAHLEITRASGEYSGGQNDFWNGDWMNGILFLNNGIDVPQYWNPDQPATPLAPLPGWDGEQRAKVIRTFRNFVFALGISKGAVKYPTLVKWSHPADPGNVPPSWDITDPAYLAGEFPLSETPGDIVDAVPLRDSLVIYKKDSTFVAQFIGGTNVFGFPCRDRNIGIAAQGCAKEFKTGVHVLFTQDADICIFDGQSIVSIASGRVKRQIHSRITETNIHTSFVTINRRQKEAWICFPTGSATWPNYAIIWNWENGTFGETFFDECADMALGAYTPNVSPLIWDNTDGEWDSMGGTWDGGTAHNTEGRILGVFPGAQDVRLLSEGYDNGTASTTAILERTGLAIAGQAQDGSPRVDPSAVKLVTKMWPLVSAPSGGTFHLQVGAQDYADSPITWESPITYDPATDEFIEPYIEGKFIAIRLTATGNFPWTFSGYDLEVRIVGRGL